MLSAGGATRENLAFIAPLEPDLERARDPSIRDLVATLGNIGVAKNVGRDETLFSEGGEARHIYLLVRGVARTVKLLRDGRRQVAGFAFPGDLLGLETLPEYSLSAEAVSDISVVSYSRDRLDRLAGGNSALQKQVTDIVAAELREAQETLLVLGRQKATERLAWFLIRKLDRIGSAGGVVAVPMNRTDIADYLGLTIETISRALAALKRKGYVAVPSANRIRLLNRSGLRALAYGEDRELAWSA